MRTHIFKLARRIPVRRGVLLFALHAAFSVAALLALVAFRHYETAARLEGFSWLGGINGYGPVPPSTPLFESRRRALAEKRASRQRRITARAAIAWLLAPPARNDRGEARLLERAAGEAEWEALRVLPQSAPHAPSNTNTTRPPFNDDSDPLPLHRGHGLPMPTTRSRPVVDPTPPEEPQ